MRTFATAVALAAAMTWQAPAQQTGTIAGVVVSADAQPQPISGAVVTVSGSGVREGLTAITDQDGRFLFSGVTPGRYKAAAAKTMYLTTEYGAPKPGRPGATVAVTAGQTQTLQMTLPRAAVITGTVRDHLGRPSAGQSVLIMRADPPSSGSGPYIELIAVTDSRGIYRAGGLMPEAYLVSVTSFGSASEMNVPSKDDVDAKLRQLEQRFGGTASASGGPPAQPDPTVAFAPVFYPGTSNSVEAVPIRVNAGEERRGIDLQVVAVRTVKVTGRVLAQDVELSTLRPQLIPSAMAQGFFSVPGNAVAFSNDGTFQFVNVIPGRYTLVVSTFARNPVLFATANITVGDSDISGIVLTMQTAPTVTGRVVFDATTAKPPQNLQLVRLSLTPVRGPNRSVTAETGAFSVSPVSVQSDSTFRFPGVYPGTYSLNALLTNVPGWALRSATINGRDILDAPFEVTETSEGLNDLVVTFTDKRSELHGTLSTASGRPPNEFVVIVYSANRDFWRPGARRTKSVRPASDGGFSLMDLPAGDYLVAAVTDADPDEWQQPSFLEQLVSASIKVTITEGQKTRQDLRVGG